MALRPLNSEGGFGLDDGNIIINANGNITASKLTISGVSNLGPASNVIITGGTANYVLVTDGSGNLSWANPTTVGGGSNIANGESSVNIPTANGNILLTANGNTSLTVTSTGVNVAGTGNFSGNLRAANFQGIFANGNSNIRIPASNGNIVFSASGNANVVFITGNGLIANGSFAATDPVIELGGQANGAPLPASDGKDRGVILNYFNTFSAKAFMGWEHSNNEFVLAKEVTENDGIVTIFGLGNVRASYFLGNVLGNIEGNITAPGNNTEVLFNDNDQINASPGFTFNKSTNALTVTGNFEAAAINTLGYANAGNFYTPGNANVLGTANVGELFTTGNVNAVGNISGLNFQAGGNISATGNIAGGNLSTSGQANVTGNVNAGNVSTAGNMSVVGNTRFTGLVEALSRLTVGDANSAPRVDLRSNGYGLFQNIELITWGDPNAATISGRLATFTTANVTNLNVSSAVFVGANITGNNIFSNGVVEANGNLKAANANLGNLVTANFFQGDGWLLTNLTIPAGSAIENGNSNVRVEPNANIVFSVTGTNAVVTVTNNSIEANGSLNATSNITANNVTANTAVYAHLVRDGNSIIDIDGTGEYIKLGVNAASNSVYVTANTTTVNANLDVGNRANIGGNLNVSGTTNVQALNSKDISANGNVNANGNITSLNANLGNLVTANFFSGDGYLLTNLTIAAGSAIVNGNSNVTVAPNANVSVSAGGTDNVTTFTSNSVVVNQFLDINANANVANWINANAIKVSGTANFLSGAVANQYSGFTGYFLKAETRSGNPGYLDVDGNASIGDRLTVNGTANFYGGFNVNGTINSNANVRADDYLIANYAAIAFRANVPNLNVSNVANIATLNANSAAVSGNLTTGNANLGNLATANFFAGDGYLLTNLTITAGSSIVNGNSNVLIVANGNVNTSVAGNANVQVVTGTGVNIAGTLNATGSATVGNLTAGTGNFSGALTANGNLTANGSANINGNLIANGTANFTGNLAAANANLGNYVYANFFEGDGSLLTNLTITAGNALLNGDSNVYVEYSGNINFRSNGVANIFVVSNTGAHSNGNLTVANTVNAQSYANGTSNLVIRTNSDVTISAGGTANVLKVTNLAVNVSSNLNIFSNLSVTGNANIGNIGAGGIITAGGNLSGANISTGGNLSVGGVANIQTISSPGEISASGNITSLANINGARLSITGNSTLANMSANHANFAGNISSGNANLGNAATANFFIGDGGLLTNVYATSSANLANGNSNVNIPVANGNVTVSVAGNSNVAVITGTGINVAGTGNFTGNLTSGGNLNVSGNAVIGGNLTVDGNLVYVNVTDLSVEDPIIQLQTGPNATPPSSNSGKDVGLALNYYDTAARVAFMGWDVSNAEIAFGSQVSISSEVANIRSGNAQLGNLATANFVSGTLTTASQPNITSVGTLSSLNVTGTVTAGNFSGNGSGLTGVTASGISNGTSNISIPVANGNINMSVGGNANVMVITSTGAVLTGNLSTGGGSGGNITGANVIGANTVNVSTALNVTGTSNLGPIGNVTITGGSSGQYLQTNGSGGLSWASISTSSISNGNSNVNIPASNGNVTISAAGNANILTVTGTGVNVAGTLNATGNANVGNLGATGVVATTLSGSLTTAAQPNITSVGTLTSLTVSGNATVGNLIGPVANGNSNVNIPAANGNVNISAAGNANVFVVTGTGANVAGTLNATGNITGANANLGNLVTANFFTGVLTTAAQPNITSIGILSSLSVTGNVSAGNLLGVLANGNSNVSIPAANGNVNISAAGNANILTVTGTGANITGTLNVSSNLTVGGKSNLGAVGNVIITGGTANYVLSTDGAGNLSWVAQSGGGGGTPGGSNTQVQFNDGNTFAGNAGFTFNKTTTTVTVNNFVASSTANLGAVGNVIITGGTNGQVLVTNGSGGLNWGNVGTAVTVDDFIGSGSQTAYTLTTIPASVDYTLVSIAGTFQPRNAYSLAGNVLTFTSAPPAAAPIEVTTLAAATYAGPNTGTFINRAYTGNGSQNTFTVTNGVTANSVIVTENGIVQEPGTDYTISGATLTFTSAPANSTAISIREIPAGGPGGSTYSSASANLNAVANTKYILNTSSASIVVTLPGSPSFGMEVGVIDGTGNANTNQITVFGNGANIQGSNANMTVNTSRAAFTLVYYNSAQGWLLTNV
jgi:hypothetical protein